MQPVEPDAPPATPWELSRNDRRLLRAMKISADEPEHDVTAT